MKKWEVSEIKNERDLDKVNKFSLVKITNFSKISKNWEISEIKRKKFEKVPKFQWFLKKINNTILRIEKRFKNSQRYLKKKSVICTIKK